MKKRVLSIVFISMFSVLLVSGCKADPVAYQDGTYIGKSGEDDRGAYGEVTITLKQNKITDCAYITWQKDGTIKDENYGKVNGEVSNQEFYDKAQLAVRAMQRYAEQLVEVQTLEGVDAISGATIAFDQFQQAVHEALEQAKTETRQ